MADKMMRQAGRFVDNTGIGVAKAIKVAQDGTQLVDQIAKKHKTVDVYFNSNDRVNVTGTGSFLSDPIDISEFNSLDILVLNDVETRNNDITLEVLTSTPRANDTLFIRYFDWNTETWTNLNDGKITVSYSNIAIQILTSHPELYWLKELKTEKIRIRLNVKSEPHNPAHRLFRAWLVGEPNV